MNLPDSPPVAPVTAAAPAAVPQAQGGIVGSIEDSGVEKASILIVDDLPEKLLVFGAVLEELGHELVFVRTGREALRAVLQREFAVILLDVNMPDIDGFDTAKLIRQHRRSAHTPIIFITASLSSGGREGPGLQLGEARIFTIASTALELFSS